MYNEYAMTLAIEPMTVPLVAHPDGKVTVGNTRVTLDTIINYYRQGYGPEHLADSFPTVPLSDIYATISYYLQHRQQVDEYLKIREAEAAEIRKKIEAIQGPGLTREELLARKKARGG